MTLNKIQLGVTMGSGGEQYFVTLGEAESEPIMKAAELYGERPGYIVKMLIRKGLGLPAPILKHEGEGSGSEPAE